MQVNRIQSNNYNATFGRPAFSKDKIVPDCDQIIIDNAKNGINEMGKLSEELYEKLSKSELKELIKELSKKTDNTWFV